MQHGFNVLEYDEFVLGSGGNYECAASELFEQELVARDIRVTHMNTICDPVVVYMDGDKYVAWYDTELRYGYMPEY